jgi:CHAD domain-containing protein
LILPEGELKDACVAAFESVLNYAADALGGAQADPVTAVHEYRKSLRRARSLLRMLRPSLSRRARRQIDVPIKEAHRSLSSSRDLAVILDTWEGLASATGLEAPKLAAAIANKRPPKKLKLGGKTLRDFDELIDMLAARLDPDLGIKDIGRGLGATYKKARRELDRSANISDQAHVHALRRRCKDLNYQLEAVTSLDDAKRLAEVRKQFSNLATELGAVTDLYQLRNAVSELATPIDADALASTNAAISEAIELAVARSLARASKALAKKPKAWVKSLKL